MWKRLSGFSGASSDTIEWGVYVDGNVIVEISPTDVGFSSDDDCGTWNLVDVGSLSSVSTITTGLWAVGSEIAPGTWRTTGVENCVWKRLSGFSGASSDTIEWGVYVDGNVIVEISPTDVGFSSDDDCGHLVASITPLELESPLEAWRPFWLSCRPGRNEAGLFFPLRPRAVPRP